MSDNSLVERSAHMRALGELLSGGGPGAGGVALIEGAAGTGKTSLLHAFAERAARSGATFAGAAASRAERDLPLSVASQLVEALSEGAMPYPWDGERAERLLKAGERDPGQGVGELGRLLLGVAEYAPLVVGVDDVHHADDCSLRLLLYLARGAGRRVIIVLTECLRASRSYSAPHAELLYQPGFRRLRCEPLSARGVARMLTGMMGECATVPLAGPCHQVSGGNPLLARALAEEVLVQGPAGTHDLVFGGAFRQAVLTLLRRAEAQPLARALAVLGGDASTTEIGELAGADAVSVGLSREALAATGLLDGFGFRHPSLPGAVLSGMAPAARTVLHLRAAEVLHGHGAAAPVVARRLLDADRVPGPWAVAALREAGEQARAEGDVPRAVGCLRLAFHDCDDDEQRPGLRFDLARAEWQADPAAAARHLPDLTGAVRDGRLPEDTADTLAAWMLWLGREDEATELLEDLKRMSLWEGLPERPSGPRARSALRWLRCFLPDAVRTWRALSAVARHMWADDVHRAEQACACLGARPAGTTPLVRAVSGALRAAIHVRRGRLEEADAQAREALCEITPRGWGAAVGIPLSVILSALTARGRYEEVEHYLDTSVPDTEHGMPFFLPYLQARGRYYLAVGRPKAARVEFQTCGELMTRWRFDKPALVPWRSDLAWAHVALGDLDAARRLAVAQLGRLPSGHARTRGITLRVLAHCWEGEARLRWLTAAVASLETSGDRLELSLALADLAAARHASGQDRSALVVARRSRRLAAQCGVGARAVALADLPESAGRRELDALSEAERRVAALAADGWTNRQIARRLYVTTSTVEQHLTRVYRKLDISSRRDLPSIP